VDNQHSLNPRKIFVLARNRLNIGLLGRRLDITICSRNLSRRHPDFRNSESPAQAGRCLSA
jgi:hypothetical protein